MARLEITLPDKFVFSTEIPIRIGDINHAGHLGHESFLVIIEEARARLLQKFGYLTIIGGIGFIITDVSVMYLKQGSYGQTLKVEIAIIDFTTKGFDMIYKITDADTELELARAKTGHLCYDRQQQKTVPIPQDFRKKLSG